MILEVGKAGKARFIRGIKKTNIFECGQNGMVVEREHNIITMYATDHRCSKIYASVVLGANRDLRKFKFVGIAYSEDKMLLDGGDIMVVVDYAARKVAVNKPELEVRGSKHWGEDVRMPWRNAHDVMFGLSDGKPEMDQEAAAAFWKWFEEGQDTIVERINAGGEDAKEMIWVINNWLAPVFPYEKEEDIEFQLGANDAGNEFIMYHFNKEQMKADAEALGEMMPESLRENWTYTTEA